MADKTKTTTESNNTGNQNLIDNDDTASERFKDFYAFCSFVLKYEEKMTFDRLGRLVFDSEPNRTTTDQQQYTNTINTTTATNTTNTINTKCRTADNNSIKKDKDKEIKVEEDESDLDSNSSDDINCISDEDSWDLVTCYCGRPYAGRPMIECSKCLTWVHLYCARIKKTNVPEVFLCQKCKEINSQRSTNSRYTFRV